MCARNPPESGVRARHTARYTGRVDDSHRCDAARVRRRFRCPPRRRRRRRCRWPALPLPSLVRRWSRPFWSAASRPSSWSPSSSSCSWACGRSTATASRSSSSRRSACSTRRSSPLLIRTFLYLSGEETRDVFIGSAPGRGEILRGLLLLPVVFVAVTAIVLGLRALFPGLHTVQENPLPELHALAARRRRSSSSSSCSPAASARSCSARSSCIASSSGWAASTSASCSSASRSARSTSTQGLDVAIAVGLLGLFWGLIYIKRRSAVMAHGQPRELQRRAGPADRHRPLIRPVITSRAVE